jgi:hypothetical protein
MKTTINSNNRSDFIFKSFSDLNGQRIISIALPFLALNSKTAALSSVGVGFYQCYTLWKTTPDKTTTGRKWADAVLLVSSAALGTLFPKCQLIFSSGVFFSTHLYKLLATDNRPTTVLQIIHQAIHLSSIYHKTPAWIVLSLLSQASQELTAAYKQGKENKTPEMIASFLLAAIRLHKASSYIPSDFGLFKAPKIAPKEPEDDLTGDLDAKIEARRFKMVDASGKEYDFGSYFHGFGKSLVKGANIHFRKTVLENGTKRTELYFRVNHIYHERLKQIMDGLKELDGEGRMEFACLFKAGGVGIDYEAVYALGQKNMGKGSAYQANFEGLGSLCLGNEQVYNLKDLVKVTLSEGATLESFQHFLSIFGLDDALQQSTKDDLEKIKLGVLFRTFFPQQSYYLEKDGAVFTLSSEQLKQKIIETVPQMDALFKKYPPVQRELFPGYVRFGVAVDRHLAKLGGRALTTVLTSLSRPGNESQEADQVVNILKNGLLSQESREKNGIGTKGLNNDRHYVFGGAQSVYTQMITQIDIDAKKRFRNFYYTSPVRLYISLDALNQGCYQGFLDRCGIRTVQEYIHRPSIFDLTHTLAINMTLFQRQGYRGHEIMIPDRIRPEFIKAMSVKSETIRQQIIEKMREENLITVDRRGQEKFNGIPINEFIHTEHYLSRHHVKHCFPQSPARAG